jgi:cadmium resistance protein CadD (predicted permease)
MIWAEILPATFVSLIAFVSTSLDNLLILIPRSAGGDAERRRVLLGYLLGVAATLLAGWTLSKVGDFVPAQYLGWLGIVPIAMGIHGAFDLARQRSPAPSQVISTGGVLAVAALTVSLGADSVGVFVPLFADTPSRLDPIVAISVLAGGLALASLARRLASAGRVRTALERWGPRLTPFLLIAIGAYILADTPSDVEVSPRAEAAASSH